MDQTLALTGIVAFTIASLVIGIRLARLGSRTGQLPEKVIAVSFLSAGFGSNALGVLWSLLETPESWTLALALTSRALLAIGGFCIALVTWRIFRPGVAWAKALFLGCSALLVLYVLRRWLVGSLAIEALVRSPLYYLESIAMILPYTWMAWESLRERTMLVRRQALGLEVEPGLPRRLLLWGVGMGTFAVLLFGLRLSPIVRQLADIDLPIDALSGFIAMVGAICLWLAFFPPKRWRQARRSP